MGTVLKILGVLFIGYWLMVIVGCSMLVSAVQQAAKKAPSSSYGSSGSGDDIVRAMREGRSDASDRVLREVLAARAQAERDRGYSSYDRPSANQPHFKPGEPMVNPNPSSSYDD